MPCHGQPTLLFFAIEIRKLGWYINLFIQIKTFIKQLFLPKRIMTYYYEEIVFNTKKENEFINITSQLEDIVSKYNLKNGFINLYNRHTTSGI
ncbi:unnamed protein product, partial [marine sediment metagenome]